MSGSGGGGGLKMWLAEGWGWGWGKGWEGNLVLIPLLGLDPTPPSVFK